jgi:hypothetical protein
VLLSITFSVVVGTKGIVLGRSFDAVAVSVLEEDKVNNRLDSEGT